MSLAVLPGDSAEQRRAELVMVELLGQQLGASFKQQRLYYARPAWAEVDAVSIDPPILVEAWAHQGPPKSAQKHKVMADVAKMAWLAATHLPGARMILLLSDEAAAAHFRGSTWMSAALAHFGIEIFDVDLPPDMRRPSKPLNGASFGRSSGLRRSPTESAAVRLIGAVIERGLSAVASMMAA